MQPDPSKIIDQQQKVLQMMYLAMGAGVVLFTAITFAITGRNESPGTEAHRNIIQTLSFAHGALAAGAVPLGVILYSMLLGAPRPADGISRSTEERAAFYRKVQKAYLFRAATFEGVALFGLVVCFLAGGRRFFDAYPAFWLNAASPVLFVLFLFFTFPHRTRIDALYRAHGFA